MSAPHVGAGAMVIPWKCLSQPLVTGSRCTPTGQLVASRVLSERRAEPPNYRRSLSNDMWSLFLNSCRRAHCREGLLSSFPSRPFIFLVLVSFPQKRYSLGVVCVSRKHVLHHTENYGRQASLNYTLIVFSWKSL